MSKTSPKPMPDAQTFSHLGASHGAIARGTASTSSVAAMADRIWFSCGLTMNLGNYESARVDAGMATDVRPGETLMDALVRCRDFVTHEIEGQSLDVRRTLHERTGETPPVSPTFQPGTKESKKGAKTKRSY